MNINTFILIPQLNSNFINGVHYLDASPQSHQSPTTSNMNADATINQMRHITGYQQPARFMGYRNLPNLKSQSQRQGYANSHHPGSNRYFYNSTMIQRDPAATNQNVGAARSNYRKSPINYRAQNQKSLITNATNSITTNIEKTVQTSDVTTSNELPQSTSSTCLSKLPVELPKLFQNADAVKQSQQLSTSNNYKNNNNNKRQSQNSEKNETIINMNSTKCMQLKRSDSKSSLTTRVATTKLVVATGATAKVITSNIVSHQINNMDANKRQQLKKQNDTMQRNSSKASHSASASASSSSSTTATSTSAKSHKNHDSSDSGLSSHNGQHQRQHQHQNSSATSVKQRKARGSNKRQDANANAAASNNATNSANPSGAQQKRAATTSGFTVNDWLQNDMYCYERRFISSYGEDNRIARHNQSHRNSTSSEAAGSDDINSSSSYEDHCPTYIFQSKNSKKSTKSRQKRQQKRKQHFSTTTTPSSAAAPPTGATRNQNATTSQQPMDIDEENKENSKPQSSNAGGANKQQCTPTAALNLRKQCTKAAALKAALNNSKFSKCQMSNALTTSPSSSSVCSSLSSISSTNSSMSSSASSSPAHSANSSPTASPTVTKRNSEHLKKVAQALVPPLRQFDKLNMNESQMAQNLRPYFIDPSLLQVYGFPVESVYHEGCIEIYKCLPKHMAEEAVTKDNKRHHRHYYGPKKIAANDTKANVINVYDGLPSSAQWLSYAAIDSGNGSGDSSPHFTDSDSSDMVEDETNAEERLVAFYTPDGVYQVFSEYDNSDEKQCVRCHKMFQVNAKGEYQTLETCSYHWGKLNNVYNGKCYVNIHSCCQGEELSEGCSQHKLHVWNGCVVGINGPYNNYVYTKTRTETQKAKPTKIYALDCEMSYTGLGLELTKITVVGYDGALVYEHFVKPLAPIVDYNTRFSGISEKDLSPDSNNVIKTFAQVQQDLLKIFDADTILIGHGLDNDLRALRLVHKTIVDTSLVFSHSTGFPYRRSLKNLSKSYLKRDIQCSDLGHNSFEDSRACLELMMWKLRKDTYQYSSYYQ